MSNQTMFDRVMSLSAVEILGDPAVRADMSAAPNQVKYSDAGWDRSDQILFGIGGAPGGKTCPAGAETLFSQQVATPFKALRMVCPSTLAPGLFVSSLKIGPTELVDGDPIPLEILSEVSLGNLISYPTAQTSQKIELRIYNANAADVEHMAVALLGLRLRN